MPIRGHLQKVLNRAWQGILSLSATNPSCPFFFFNSREKLLWWKYNLLAWDISLSVQGEGVITASLFNIDTFPSLPLAHQAFSSLTIFRENLHLLEEGQVLQREELDERIAREEFRRPRESLLNICTEFYKHCGPRLKILQNLAGEPRVTSLELLDVKSHMRYPAYFKTMTSICTGYLKQ